MKSPEKATIPPPLLKKAVIAALRALMALESGVLVTRPMLSWSVELPTTIAL